MNFADVKKITIPNGNVAKITAQNMTIWKKTFVNQIPISTDIDGSVFNGVGYMKDRRLTVNGTDDERGLLMTEPDWYVTGFIPITSGTDGNSVGELMLYLKNINVPPTNAINVFLYNANKKYVAVNYGSTFLLEPAYTKIVYTLNGDGYINSLDLSAYTGYYKDVGKESCFVRIAVKTTIDENSIITVNEVI